MRSIEDAQKYWPVLESQTSLSGLRDVLRGNHGNLSQSLGSGLRSMCWKSFLFFEDLDFSSWPARLRDSRDAYLSLRNHYLRNIEHPDEVDLFLDPLSGDTDSAWNNIRKDEDLRAEILQDVDRCMPEHQYFRQPDTQNTMVDILFVWSKLNSDVGYRQGMHELLALVLWVVERDAVQLCQTRKETKSTKILKICLDSSYVTHDTFTLFSLIMHNAKASYEVSNHHDPSRKPNANLPLEQPMVVRSKRIMSEYLGVADPRLAMHLQDLNIVPQVFIMRWVRLLFGREFSFDQTLQMWDVLFQRDAALECVDYICVVMILRIRWELVTADANTALTLLLRYPGLQADMEASSLVEDAIHLKENLNTETGFKLIQKYTGRPPPELDLSYRPATSRPLTPLLPPNAHPTRSPLSSIRALQQPGGLEALLQDAARGVYTRGEKWGVNKAVRDAVVEVRKNVQTIQQQGAMNAIRSNMPSSTEDQNERPVDEKLSYENLFNKVETLHAKNIKLAAMLQAAVGELWEQHKTIVQAHRTGNEVHNVLTLAIAKVQLVQVYLEDPDMPLPAEQDGDEPSPPKAKPEVQVEEKTADSGYDDSAIKIRNINEEKEDDCRPEIETPNSSSQQMPITAREQYAAQYLSQSPSNERKTIIPSQRPPLAQSSFSWMLGQDSPGDIKVSSGSTKDNSASSHSARATFVSATHFTPTAPDMSFLFGELEASADSSGTTRRGSASVRKGKVKVKDDKAKGTKDESGKTKAKGPSLVMEEDGEEGEVFKLGVIKR